MQRTSTSAPRSSRKSAIATVFASCSGCWPSPPRACTSAASASTSARSSSSQPSRAATFGVSFAPCVRRNRAVPSSALIEHSVGAVLPVALQVHVGAGVHQRRQQRFVLRGDVRRPLAEGEHRIVDPLPDVCMPQQPLRAVNVSPHARHRRTPVTSRSWRSATSFGHDRSLPRGRRRAGRRQA